jgi:hypothetical protein
MQIQIPHNFEPRDYQLRLLSAMDSGYRWAVTAWHRRAGKDKTLFNLIVKKSLERRGVYYYFFPEFAQGRRVIWDGIDGAGMAFLEHVPRELFKQMHKTDMKIEMVNGSIIQIVGTDNYDKVRGSNPVGCVFSEYAYQNPAAWDVVSPILGENNGWAVFNSTPCGKNHFYKLYQGACKMDDWYADLVTVDDSIDPNGNKYMPDKAIEMERALGRSEEWIQQEYYCDFNANSNGFYYLKYLNEAEEEGRIGHISHDPSKLVDTWWDIGVGDSTAIWFTQTIGREVHLIDYYQNNAVGLEHYTQYLQGLPYMYHIHNFPHDMANTEFGTGRSRIEMAEDLLGSKNVNIIQKISIEDGINAARIILPRCWFDERKCEKGITALYNYHRQWDDKLKEFKNKPVHDWSSHPADAFRYFAVGLTMPRQASLMNNKLSRYGRRMTTKSWMVA